MTNKPETSLPVRVETALLLAFIVGIVMGAGIGWQSWNECQDRVEVLEQTLSETEIEWRAQVRREIEMCEEQVRATEEHCTEVLDCRYEHLHPDRCDPTKCKYHALERSLGLTTDWSP